MHRESHWEMTHVGVESPADNRTEWLPAGAPW